MKKANVFKKILAGALTLTTALSVSLLAACGDDEKEKTPTEAEKEAAFIDSIGGVSETYTGAVSENAYTTNTEAAEAYVQQEIIGKKSVTIVSSQSIATLRTEEITALNIPTQTGLPIVSVEKIEVEYTENDLPSDDISAVSSAPVSGAVNANKKVTVYIVKYSDNAFKYFTPCPINGDTITQSYYNSVFDAETYLNCTYTTKMSMTIKMNIPGQGEMNLPMEMTQTVKYAQNKIYMEQTATSMGINETMAFYLEQTEDDFSCYLKDIDSEVWEECDLYMAGFSSIEDLAPFADQYLDYTYFTKTSYGFELSDDNAALYVKETMQNQLGDLTNDFNLTMFAKYYVSNGVLSGMRMDMTIDYTVTAEDVTISAHAVAVTETKISDIGKTTVVKPF